jgi:hypothetical protein
MELRSTPHSISDFAAASISGVGSTADKRSDYYNYRTQIVIDRWLAHLVYIRKVQRLNLGPETGYPDCGFHGFPQSLPEISQEYFRTHFFFDLLFASGAIIWYCLMRAIEIFVSK